MEPQASAEAWGRFEGHFDGHDLHLGVKGLGQKCSSPTTHSEVWQVPSHAGADEDERWLGLQALKAIKQLQPVDFGAQTRCLRVR